MAKYELVIGGEDRREIAFDAEQAWANTEPNSITIEKQTKLLDNLNIYLI